MGRKGVSKRKKAQVKSAQPGADNSASNVRKALAQPEAAGEKDKTWSKPGKKR